MVRYVVIIIFIDLLCLSKRRNYWKQRSDLWDVATITNLMARGWWEKITGALHLIDNAMLQKDLIINTSHLCLVAQQYRLTPISTLVCIPLSYLFPARFSSFADKGCIH